MLAVTMLLCADAAFAYRPFDGTDAAVAEPDEMEVELQPAGGKTIASQKMLVAPDLVLNYGFAKDWEAVLEGRLETPLPTSGPTTFTDGGAFLKHILRPGVLQDQTGPSIATEFGVLLPDSIGDTRFGASIAAIVSQRWDWGTAHLNIAASSPAISTPIFSQALYWRGHTSGRCAPLLNFSTRKNSARRTQSQL